MSNNFNWDNLLEKAKKRDSQQAQKNAISPERYYKDQLGENYSNLEDKYKSLKKANKDTYKNTRNAYWKDSIKGTLTFWDDSDDVTKEQKTAYQKSKDTYKARRVALEQEYANAQKNKWELQQKSNADVIDNDSELSELLSTAYDAKIKYESAQKELNNNQQSFGQTPYALMWDTSVQDSYNQNLDIYNSVSQKIKDAGYDFDSLLDTYTRQKNSQFTESVEKAATEFADEHPVLSTGAHIGLNAMQTIAIPEIVKSGVKNLFTDDYVPLDTNAASFFATNTRNAIAEKNTSNITESVLEKTDSELASNATAFLYQTGLSIGDFASVAWMPKTLSLAIMGSSAAANSAKEATERGVSADKAMLTAGASAAAEIFFEHFSIDKLKALKASGQSGVKNAVMDILKQSFTEGSEELLTELSNAITDQIINGDDSALMQRYQQLIDSGIDESDAQKQVASEFAKQVGLSFLGGAISGNVTSSGVSAINNVNASIIGKSIKSNQEALNTLFDVVSSLDETTSANKQLQKIKKSKGVSNNAIGGLYLQTVNDYKSKFESAKTEKELIDMFNSVAPNLKGQIGSDIATVYIEARQKLIKKSVSSEETQADTANNTESAEMLYRADEKALIEQSEQSYSPNAKVANTGIHEALDGTDLGIEVVDTRTNQPVKIKGVEYSSAGEMTFVTDKGEDIEISDLDVSNQHLANVINTASQFDTNGANAFIKYAPRDHNFNTYTIMASNAYKVSRTQPELTFEQVKGSLNSVIRTLGMDVTRKFFDAGERDAQINKAATELITNVQKQNKSFEIDKKKLKTVEKFNKVLNSDVKPGATVIAKNLQPSQKAEIELIDELAKRRFNREVIIVADLEELGYGKSNGEYTNGKIVLPLNADGGMMSVYLGHELFHDLKQTAPKQADALEKFIIDKLKNSPLYEYDKRVEEIIDKYKFKGTREQQVALANEEIAGNACFTVLSEQANFEQLVNQDKKLAQKVRDFFADFIDKIKKALKTVAQTNKEYRALQGDIEAKEQILAMFDEALKASYDIKISSDITYYSAKENKNANVNDLLTVLRTNFDAIISTPVIYDINSEVMIPGVKASESIESYFNSIGNVAFNKQIGTVELVKSGAKSTVAHGFGPDKASAVSAIKSVIENGIIIDKQKNWKGRGYDTVVIAGKGNIYGEKSIIGVVVKSYYDNKYTPKFYLHELVKIKEVDLQNQTAPQLSVDTVSKSTPNNNVPQKDTVVNNYDMQDNVKNSLKENLDEVDKLLEENEELSAMNEQLQEMLAIARKETTITGRHNMSRNSVDNVATYLRQNYGSTYSKRSLSARLEGLYDYIANAGVDIDNDYIWRTAKDIAIELLDATTHKDTTVYDQYADLRNRIKSTAVIVSDEVKGDMADYNEFRKHNFGRLRLVNDGGISLDTFYNELAQEYPEMFDADAVLGDQLEALANVFEITQPVYYNSAQQYAESEGLSLDEYANIVASDIFNKYFDVIETKTFAEKKQKELTDLKVKYQNRIVDMRKSYRDDYEQRLKAEKAKSKLKVDKVRADKADALAKQKAHFNSQIEKKRERRKIKAYRESIKKVAFELADWLEKPKKEKSVPDKFQKVLLEFLNSLNFESYNYYGELTKESIKWSDKASKLASQLNHLNSSQNDFGYVEIPAHISKTLDSIIDEYGDVPLNEIDAFGLKYLDDALHYLKGVVTQSHKLHNNEKYETIQALGKASIEQLEAKKGFKKDNLAVQYLNFDMLDSFSYAKMLGDAGQSIFDSLYRGFEKRVWKIKKKQDYLEEVLNDIDTKNWTGPKAKMTKFELQNGTVHLTPAMCMEIYLLSKREQGRKHLLGKGIVLSSDIEKITKNKLNKKLNIDAKLEQVTPISLTLDDVYKITDSLTSEQKKVADKMQRYLATTVADWGNEVTMQMYMHRGFTDKDYWTIESFNDFVKTNDENSNNASLWAIINQSFTHQTIKNADNAVVIHDAFDTFNKHTEQMINYNAFAVPLSNAMKWFNYRDKDTNQTIKNCLHATYGTGATNYFLKFIKDLNGVKEPVDTYASRIPSVLTRNLKTAAVVSNIRVTVQQPMSYFKAWAVMDSKYLSKAIFSANGAKKAKEYCAIALWKSWGFYETDLGKNVNNIILNNQSTLDKIRDKSMILSEKADELTWGYLWNACELEIADKNKELKKGSEEFNKAVADRLTEIINETQVVDSVFHRSQIARSKSDLVKMSTSFMSEAIKSYNMLRNAYMDVRENPNSNNKKKFVRTTTAFVITQVAVSAVSSLVDTIRYNDDDEEWYETYAEYLKDNLINNLNPFNIIPLVKDIMSTAQGWESGRMDMTAIGDIIKVAINWGKRALGDSKRTLWEDIYDSAQAISNLTGMPFGNALRDLKAIVNIFTKKNIGKVYTNNERYQKLYEYQMEGDQKNYDKVYQELIDAQVEQNDIDNGMKMALFNNDARVAQAGISYSSGEMNEFINLSEEIINDGFSEQAVIDAIKHYAQKLEDAKSYLDDEDQDGYESILEKLTQSGYPEEEIVNAINSITIKEQMKDDSVSQIYSEQDLKLAIDNEDYHSYKKMYSSIIDIHIQNGKSQAEAENKVKSSLKSSFIDEYLSGDDYTRNNIERKLIATGLFDNDDFPKWLADSYNSDQINGTNAMIAAFEGGYSSTQRYVQERIQAKVNAGQTENNAKKGIRSSISSEYKNKFIYGNADTRARIIIYMTYTGLYGNRKETIEWLNENWNN